MAYHPALKKACWSLAVVLGLYYGILALLLIPWLQRHALYANKIHTSWWTDLNKAEQFGYLKNQIQPFNIATPDGEVLYAWHVLPLRLYAKHEAALVQGPAGPPDDVTQTVAFKLLATDPESRLVVNFHGNAGTVGQGWRTDTYRALATGDANKIHVLTVDYRGFGYSTGSPTEQGLITDGVTLVKWALEVAHIPPERIILLGQSLGTAVTTAVAEHFALESRTEFAGVVLVAGFSDIPTLMLTYSVGGYVPILSALRPYPPLQRFFARRVKDTWQTAVRLSSFIRHSKNVNLVIIHATNDYDIPWKHSDALFYAAANATSKEGMTMKQIDGVKDTVDLGEGGRVNSWNAGGHGHDRGKRIRQEIVMHGGHNRIVTYPVVAKAVLGLFDLGV
ncbi:MAG: alpha beta-Hydrolase [Lasallia pustulata]|uniref:Alpha beta-Hydrolase n=1 Tax=Lasallia pustulata TaxID=136370 RepID=A0A5M8PKZ9_9LECA|nr:MAG: alpha beta-Hydrolase [Lasallia pustulata]